MLQQMCCGSQCSPTGPPSLWFKQLPRQKLIYELTMGQVFPGCISQWGLSGNLVEGGGVDLYSV